MKNKWVIWTITGLEVLFALCAGSVLVYRVLGIAFDFGLFSYRVANIVISLVLIVYIINGLFKRSKNILIWVSAFSAFHLIEGVIIGFWFKVVIHALILIVVGIYYLQHKNIELK
ncbi:MAG TPA: hypothetical protein ENI97_03300 [Gammaproteobacteria bacterium]|nr:hypothetical protein [Gammaproteobacteria bacterium]